MSLVPGGEDWIPPTQRMIENFSRCWGGAGDIVIPVNDGGEIPTDMWNILDTFDPDRLGYYLPTPRGQQLAAPDAFEVWLDSQVKRLVAENENMSLQETRDQLLDESFMQTPWTPAWKPPALLEEQVRRRLAPLDREQPFDHVWTADSAPGHDLLDVLNILEVQKTSRILQIRADEIDPRIHLMLTSRLGSIAPSFHSALADAGVEVSELSAGADQLPLVLDLCWERNIDMIRWDSQLREALGGTEDLSLPPDWWRLTPFGLTEAGCSWYVVGRPWRRTPSAVLVVGDSAEDFALAMALDRLYRRSYWCPYAFLVNSDELSTTVRRRLGARLHRETGYGTGGDEDNVVLITSLSLGPDDISAILPILAEGWGYGGAAISSRLKGILPSRIELPKPARLYDTDQIMRQRYEPFVGSQMVGPLDTPSPSGISPGAPRVNEPFGSVARFFWHVDALIDGIQLPPRSILSKHLAEPDTVAQTSVRASSDGISYFSREPFFIPAGASLYQMTYRPRLRLPDAPELFQALLEETGLRGITSQAGRYSGGAIALWGGLEALAGDLSDPRRNALFEAYRKKTDSGIDPGVWMKAAKRRYLSFWDARRVTGLARKEMRDVLDTYIRGGILVRGVCLKCPRCNLAAWYSSQEVGREFRCPRCRQSSVVTQETWRKPSEPSWHYQLDEVAFQAFDHDARAPILALDRLRREARSFIFSSEMDVFDRSRLVAEIDMLALVNGNIMLGEAKATDRLGKTDAEERAVVRKLVRVAEAITAHELVIATTKRWSSATARILQDESKGRVRLQIIEGLGDETST
jgi:hypothetical protein